MTLRFQVSGTRALGFITSAYSREHGFLPGHFVPVTFSGNNVGDSLPHLSTMPLSTFSILKLVLVLSTPVAHTSV